MVFVINKILSKKKNKKSKGNKLSTELDLYSNLFSLDIVRMYSNVNILPEDFIIIEEKILNKNTLFYPEKILSIMRCLMLSVSNQGSFYKKNLKEQFFLLSKYYSYIFLWKQINNIFYIYLNEFAKHFLHFLHLLLLKSPNFFFLISKIPETISNLDFSLDLFYVLKKNSYLNEIVSYQLNKYNFKIEELIYLFFFFASEKKNYCNFFKYSNLFLFNDHIFLKFKPIIRVTIQTKIKYTLENNYLFGEYNQKDKFQSNKNILKLYRGRFFQKFANLKLKKKPEVILNNFRIFFFKYREYTIQFYTEIFNCKLKIIEKSKLKMQHIFNKKKIINLSNFNKNKFIQENTIYINSIFNV
jgi:hypothetical protein